MLEREWTKMSDSIGTTWSKVDVEKDVLINIYKERGCVEVFYEMYKEGKEIVSGTEEKLTLAKKEVMKHYEKLN